MTIKAIGRLSIPENGVITMEVSMTLREWRAVLDDIQLESVPACSLKRAIKESIAVLIQSFDTEYELNN